MLLLSDWRYLWIIYYHVSAALELLEVLDTRLLIETRQYKLIAKYTLLSKFGQRLNSNVEIELE